MMMIMDGQAASLASRSASAQHQISDANGVYVALGKKEYFCLYSYRSSSNSIAWQIAQRSHFQWTGLCSSPIIDESIP